MDEQPKVREKRCPKCGQRKPITDFPVARDMPDGHQAYCKPCKNALGRRRREINVSARLRHHFSTRIASQLGEHAPEGLVKDLPRYLGYSLNELAAYLRKDLMEREGKSLRKALNEGYHIDHIHPLSRYKVLTDKGVDWDVFRACWAMSNLKAIPAADNLAKGAKIIGD